MPFNVKRRGKLTYYYTGDAGALRLVTEEQPDGDLRIYSPGSPAATRRRTCSGATSW